MRKRSVGPTCPVAGFHSGKKQSCPEETSGTKPVQSIYPPLQEALFRERFQPHSNEEVTEGFSHNRRRVLPDPNFPQMSDNSP